MVPMNLEFVKDLWLPNIFIYNLKTYKVMLMIRTIGNQERKAEKIWDFFSPLKRKLIFWFLFGVCR